VTAAGTISVDRIRKNTSSRPRTAIRASAYPAIEANSVCKTRLTTAMIAELRSPVPIGAVSELNRSRKFW